MDLGLILSITGLILTVYGVVITLKQRNRRKVCYQIVSSVAVVSISADVRNKVEVKFDGKLIEDAHQVVLRVWNAGEAFIQPNEFITPIRFHFGNAEILGTPEILETDPAQLKDRVFLECDATNKNVMLKPLLLNSHDSITWKVLLTSFVNMIKIEGAIAGVREIKFVERSPSDATTTNRGILDAMVSAVLKKWQGS